MTTLTADACTNLGILAVPPTPDVRKAEDELDPKTLDQHRKALARIAGPLSPNTTTPPVRQRNP